ncbi:MAG TPA: family 43 glycosylhydrolase, partial [Balneolales bacterium]|nr:family 43 glycosylhydrolase [Balneolales bacterium]
MLKYHMLHREKQVVSGYLLPVMACFVFMMIIVGLGYKRANAQTRSGNHSITKSRDTLNPGISDYYQKIAAFKDHLEWGSHNVHDPTVIKAGKWFYLYSTDAAYGRRNLKRVGIQVRRSKDLIHWQFLGWAFNGIPEKARKFVTKQNHGKKPRNIWAPFIMKVGKQYRLYYAVSVFGSRASYVGLATSESPQGPWKQQGSVVKTTKADSMNAIDPSVVVNPQNGTYWMSYGSYFGGIFMIQLNPSTGMAVKPGDKGHRIAFRLKKGNSIEGSDLLYNPQLKKYYLFISYGWLGSSYNVRVGRANRPQGPYYDFDGKNMADVGNDVPRITAEYKFDHSSGWQGFGGSCSLRIGNKYFYLSQARPASHHHMMDLHVHKMVFTLGGWPVISPERYDDVPQETLTPDSLDGNWEYIVLNKTKSLNVSRHIQLLADGMISGGSSHSKWSFDNGI